MCAENTMTTTLRFSNYTEGHTFLLSIEEYEMRPAAVANDSNIVVTPIRSLYTNNYSNDTFRILQLYRYTIGIT